MLTNIIAAMFLRNTVPFWSYGRNMTTQLEEPSHYWPIWGYPKFHGWFILSVLDYHHSNVQTFLL